MYEGDLLLARRAAKGDDSAFEEIVRQNQNLIYNACVAALRSHHDALDVSQETFLKAYRAINDYRGDSKMSSWLYRICINCISDFKRRNGRDTLSLEADEDGEGGIGQRIADGDPSPEETAERNEKI